MTLSYHERCLGVQCLPTFITFGQYLFFPDPLLCSSRLWSLRLVLVSIWGTPCGTQETLPSRSVSCGRTPGMLAGRTRSPTAGSSSTDHRLDTSGTTQTHTNTQRHIHSYTVNWLTNFTLHVNKGSLLWGFWAGGGHRDDYRHQHERRETGRVLLLSGKYHLVQSEVPLQRWVSAN